MGLGQIPSEEEAAAMQVGAEKGCVLEWVV